MFQIWGGLFYQLPVLPKFNHRFHLLPSFVLRCSPRFWSILPFPWLFLFNLVQQNKTNRHEITVHFFIFKNCTCFGKCMLNLLLIGSQKLSGNRRSLHSKWFSIISVLPQILKLWYSTFTFNSISLWKALGISF